MEKKCDEILCSFWQIGLAFFFIIIQCYFLLYRHSSWCLMFSGVTMMLLNSFWTQWGEIMVKHSDIQEILQDRASISIWWPITHNKSSKWNSYMFYFTLGYNLAMQSQHKFNHNPFIPSLWTADVSPRSSTLKDVSRGGNKCLHNKSGSHGVLSANLFNFTFLLVDCGKALCWSANELQ